MSTLPVDDHHDRMISIYETTRNSGANNKVGKIRFIINNNNNNVFNDTKKMDRLIKETEMQKCNQSEYSIGNRG